MKRDASLNDKLQMCQTGKHSVMYFFYLRVENRWKESTEQKNFACRRECIGKTQPDDTLRHLLPWDIELVIDEPVDEQEEEPEV